MWHAVWALNWSRQPEPRAGGSMRRLLVPFLVALLATQAVVAEATPARACALDQRPSLSTNGRLVVLNKQVARTQAELAIWAFFVVPGVYRTGQPVTMTENR